MKKRVLALLTALILMFGLLAACGGGEDVPDGPTNDSASSAPGTSQSQQQGESTPADDGKTYNLIVSLTKGEKNTTALQEYLADIEAASNGRITFEIYYSGQLLAVPEIPQGLETGVADISEFVISEFPTLFPLASTIVGLPFLGMTNETVETFGMLYDEFPEFQQEFADAGMVLLNYMCTQPYNFHFTFDSPVVTLPEDLSGLKIITSRADVTNFLAKYGASAVASAPPDYYTNLSNGVVEGTLLHYPMMFNNGLIETVKQHLIVEEGGGMAMDTSVYVMSSAAFEKLPADLQALFTDEARNEKFFNTNQDIQVVDGEKGLQASKDQGNAIHFMSDAELAAWKDAFAPINEQTLADLDAKGLPATTIYNRAQEIIAELKG